VPDCVACEATATAPNGDVGVLCLSLLMIGARRRDAECGADKPVARSERFGHPTAAGGLRLHLASATPRPWSTVASCTRGRVGRCYGRHRRHAANPWAGASGCGWRLAPTEDEPRSPRSPRTGERGSRQTGPETPDAGRWLIGWVCLRPSRASTYGCPQWIAGVEVSPVVHLCCGRVW
jgi:hypothetical protein